MKFCPNCGTQMEDNAAFCGNCGTSMKNGLQAAQTNEPVAGMTYGADSAPEQANRQGTAFHSETIHPATGVHGADYGTNGGSAKKNKKPFMIVAIIAVCLAAIIGIVFAVKAFTGSGSKTKVDKNDFIGIQMAFFEERFAGISSIASRESFSSDITVSGKIESTDPNISQLGQFLDGTAVIFKLDTQKNNILANIVLRLQGSNIIEADMTLADQELGFAIPAADDHYYVGDLQKIMQNFGASEEEIKSVLKSKSITRAMSPKVFAEAFKSIMGAGINENSLTITEKTSVTLDKLNETVEGTYYVWQPSLEDCKAVMNKLADEMETGVALGEFIKQINEMGGTFSLDDTQYENVEEMIQKFRENTDKYAQNMVDSGFKWQMATNQDGKVVLISVTSSEVEMGYQGLITDQNVKEQIFIAENGANQVRIDNAATVSNQKWTGTASVGTPYGALPVNYDLDMSKHSELGFPYGTVSVSLSSFGEDINFEIVTQDGESSSTDMIVKLQGLERLTESVLSSLEITVNTTDTSTAEQPSGVKVDISDYTEEDYAALQEELLPKIVNAVTSTPAVMGIIMSLLQGTGAY